LLTKQEKRDGTTKSIENRLEKAEQRLNIDRQAGPDVLVIFTPTDELASSSLPENTEDWITYKQHIRKCPDINFMLLFASDELAARGLSGANLQKATKDNELAKVSLSARPDPDHLRRRPRITHSEFR
jgi:hypothetical protein